MQEGFSALFYQRREPAYYKDRACNLYTPKIVFIFVHPPVNYSVQKMLWAGSFPKEYLKHICKVCRLKLTTHQIFRLL